MSIEEFDKKYIERVNELSKDEMLESIKIEDEIRRHGGGYHAQGTIKNEAGLRSAYARLLDVYNMGCNDNTIIAVQLKKEIRAYNKK